MVDAKRPLLGKDGQHGIIDRLAGVEVMAKRLFKGEANAVVRQARLSQAIDGRGEQRGRGGKENRQLAIAAVLPQRGLQRRKAAALGDVHRHVIYTSKECLHLSADHPLGGQVARQTFGNTGAKRRDIHDAAR